MSYDLFAETFSQSRKNHPWPELEYIIEDMKRRGFSHVLDVGCGNGRFLEESQKLGFSPQVYLGVDNSRGMIHEAKILHPEYEFRVHDMCDLGSLECIEKFDAIVLLASFHHLESVDVRGEVLTYLREFLSPGGVISMTNWNLRDQEKYEKNHRGNGDFDIKIGHHMRYYHGFTCEELAGIFEDTGYTIIQNRIFDGGRNIISIIQ